MQIAATAAERDVNLDQGPSGRAAAALAFAMAAGLAVVVIGVSAGWPASWVPLVLAASLGGGLLLALPHVRASAAWAAMACAGQGATLALTVQGPIVRYPHLAWVTGLDEPSLARFAALGVLALQLFLLMGPGRGHLRAALEWLRANVPLGRAAVLAGAVVATSAALSADPGALVLELMAASLLQGLHGLTIVAAARSLPDAWARTFGERLSVAVERGFLPWVAALWAFTVSAVLGWAVYQYHPHIVDEVVYLLHARGLAEGAWDLPLPPVPAAFELDLVTYERDRAYVPVPPGWPILLSLGVRAGVPWLVNPFLGAATVPLVHGLMRRMAGIRTAGWTTLLLAASPWFLFMNMSLMTHTFTLLAAVLAAYATARWVGKGAWRWTLVAGVGLGVVALNRPLEGLIAAGVCGLWGLGIGGRTWRARVTGVGTMAIASAAVVGLTLPYNRMFTGGRGTTFPIMAFIDRMYGPGANALGFGPERGLGWRGLDPFPGHGVLDVIVNTALNLALVNTELLGWMVGSVVAAAWVLAVGKARRVDWALASAAAAVVVAHAFYWFSGGPDFGARYWYLALIPLAALAARSVLALQERTDPGRVGFAALVLIASAVFVSVPWRAADKYRDYRGMRADIPDLARVHEWGTDDVILISGDRDPDYASAAIYNPVDLRGPGPLYAWDRDPETRAAVMAAFPGRRFWRVDGPTRTGGTFQVVGRVDPAAEEAGSP